MFGRGLEGTGPVCSSRLLEQGKGRFCGSSPLEPRSLILEVWKFWSGLREMWLGNVTDIGDGGVWGLDRRLAQGPH